MTSSAPTPATANPLRRAWAALSSTRAIGVMTTLNVICQILIIGTGGAVRLTGSGLGCSTFPECEPGQFTPAFHEATSYHTYIEYGNRMMGVVVGLQAVLLAMAILTHRPRRSRQIRLLGAIPAVGVALQGLMGAVIVWLHLHPGFVAMHFLVSMALVWVSTWLWVRWRQQDVRSQFIAAQVSVRWRQAVTGLALVAVLATVVVVVLGVITTGAGPHSGDEEVGYRFALDPAMVARFHAAGVWVLLAAEVGLLVLLWRVPAARVAARRTTALLVVTLAQGGIGYLQFFTGLPVALVNLHLVGAAALMVALTVAVLAIWPRPALVEYARSPASPAVTAS